MVNPISPALARCAALLDELRHAREAGDDSEATDERLNAALERIWRTELTEAERVVVNSWSARAWPGWREGPEWPEE